MDDNTNDQMGQSALQPDLVQHSQSSAPPPPPEEPVKDSRSDDQKELADEIEKIKKKQKFFKVVVIILCAILLSAAGLGFYVYKKICALRSMFDVMNAVSHEDGNASGGNSMSPINAMPIPVPTASSTGMNSSSLSQIGFDPEMVSAMNTSENAQDLKAVVNDYKDNPEIKKFMEELSKDPEFKDIVVNPGDPSRVAELMKKLNNPRVLSRLSARIMENPSLLPALMRMANDPRIKQMISQQKEMGVEHNRKIKKRSKTSSGAPAEPSSGSNFGEHDPPGDGE